MSNTPVVYRLLRRVYELADGDPGAEVWAGDAGRNLGLTSFHAAGYLSVLVRLQYLSDGERESFVRLAPAGVAWMEEGCASAVA